MRNTILLEVTCTLVVLTTAVMLAAGWFGRWREVDAGSIAVVFSGALLGRCVLAAGAARDAQRPPSPAPARERAAIP